MSQDKDYYEQLITLFKGFTEEHNIPVIMGLQMKDKPKKENGETNFPYIGYTITSQNRVANLREDINDELNVLQRWREQWELTISFTAVSKTYFDAIEIAHLFNAWLKNTGRSYMENNNIAFVNIMPITTRDFIFVNDYERRQGFDCILRFERIIEKDIERIINVDIEHIK